MKCMQLSTRTASAKKFTHSKVLVTGTTVIVNQINSFEGLINGHAMILVSQALNFGTASAKGNLFTPNTLGIVVTLHKKVTTSLNLLHMQIYHIDIRI